MGTVDVDVLVARWHLTWTSDAHGAAEGRRGRRGLRAAAAAAGAAALGAALRGLLRRQPRVARKTK